MASGYCDRDSTASRANEAADSTTSWRLAVTPPAIRLRRTFLKNVKTSLYEYNLNKKTETALSMGRAVFKQKI
jgi:hypothetical protein